MNQTKENNPSFISKIISACANNVFFTVILIAALGMWAFLSLRQVPMDAIPDLSDVQVIIYTEWPGRTPELIEDQITYPISSEFLSAPKVKYVRGLSAFGYSFVYVVFKDGTDIYWARSRIIEYLGGIQSKLPEGVTPTLGPDATGVGWVYGYAVIDETGENDLAQLRSIQDWKIRYALRSVPGVSEIASVGGFVKQYQVSVDPNKLRSYNISIEDVSKAIKESNDDTGGEVIEIAEFEYMIRGRGYVKNLRDLEDVVIKLDEKKNPVYLRDVAMVQLGPETQRAVTDLDGKGNVVGGIVVMRYGENPLRVIQDIKAKLKEIEPSLPKGLKIVPWYDRSELIEGSIKTLTDTLIQQLIVVSIIIFIFLMNVRSSLIPILVLPLAVLLAFIPLFYQGLSANIMSLGGIALAIGSMVDASIIIIENIHKKHEKWELEGRPGTRVDMLIEAMQEVGPSIFFSLLVMTVAFMPIFSLGGQEGRLFKPLAFTTTYALGWAALLSITLIPALAVLFIRGKISKEENNPLNRWVVALYIPVVNFVVKYPKTVILVAFLLLIPVIPVWLSLGKEFMPPLYEGTILYMPTTSPGMSITEAGNFLQSSDREILQFPEVQSVFGKMGKANTATDPAPLSMVETTIVLKPRNEWRSGVTYEGLIKEMNQKLQYPGMTNIWWQPIQTRTEMLATGIRSPIGILVYGDDLAKIEKTSLEIEAAVSKIPGTLSAYAERSVGAFYMDFAVNRREASRYGLRVKNIEDIITSAIGGMNVSKTIEKRERYPINVRYAREFREDPESLRRTFVTTAAGDQIPLSQVTSINFVRGPDMVRSQNANLVGFVYVDPGEVPLVDYVKQAKEVVKNEVVIPTGMSLDWAGQFLYYENAMKQLAIILPVTLFAIFILLYFNTKSFVETGIVLLALPFSLIGAIWLLYFLGYNISIAVWVGFIALAGLDAETGVVMLLYLTLAHKRRKEENKLNSIGDLQESIVEGAAKRIRPKLMTVLVAMIGLLPLLWSTGEGADVMKRIAAPMIGGLGTSFVSELFIYPAIFFLWKKRELKRLTAKASIQA
ncbi:MAG: CusA/CzcA family heavy metal efflux RND transporter [Bacteriovoracaceae bacterium]|nr:CusA/CzcA family heavy metal efflux RND transporter [Bacteriovoracaceae bacterium]